MIHKSFLFLTFLTVGVNAATNKTFPKDFKFGVATSAYQIEGGWNADGKGENIWDYICHTDHNPILNNQTGDVACDSYHKYKEDVALLKELGVQRYRFSLSWSRILPTGYANEINQAGIDYYINLLTELKSANIEPLVTLHHSDLPQPLQNIGGWPNAAMVDYFADYARICFEKFGDFVPLWTTINEPMELCHLGYGTGDSPPQAASSGIGEYLCAHTILKAHAKAYHIYDEEFRAKQNGRVSIVLDTSWFEPASDGEEDVKAAETNQQFNFGWFGNPVFKRNYPQVMIDRIAMRSEKEGFPKSRLPVFTEEEIEYISGTGDFIAVNSYSTSYVKAIPEPSFDGEPSLTKDRGVETYQDPNWESSDEPWLKVVPWGMRKLLNWLSDTYDNIEIIITENGYADNGTMDDSNRVSYHREYLSNILLARLEDGVNVTGYTAWSLMDNLEWSSGYTVKFGLYHVDFESENRTRTPKSSSKYMKNVIATRCLVDECE